LAPLPASKSGSHQGESGRDDGAHHGKNYHAVKRAVTHFAASSATDARLHSLYIKIDSTPEILPNFALFRPGLSLASTCRAILPTFAHLPAEPLALVRLPVVGSVRRSWPTSRIWSSANILSMM